MPTLNNLLSFTPYKGVQHEIDFYNDSRRLLTKYQQDANGWGNGTYYLGGQIKLALDDEITFELIEKVNMINQKHLASNNYYNGYELQSLYNAIDSLLKMQQIVEKYKEICEIRIRMLEENMIPFQILVKKQSDGTQMTSPFILRSLIEIDMLNDFKRYWNRLFSGPLPATDSEILDCIMQQCVYDRLVH